MVKNVQKDNKKPEFFTETVICFTIQSIEHKIKLAIYGFFKSDENGLIPVPSKYKVIEIKKENLVIKISPKVTKFVDKWIKNNPNKFSSFIARELGIMIRLSSIPPSQNPSLLKNTVDSK